LFVGSSSIRLWDLQRYFPQLKTINRGFGGSEIADAVHFADRLVIKHRPKVVVLYAGDNDAAQGKSAQTIHADFITFCQRLKSSLPQTRILYISIKPSIARWHLRSTIEEANSKIRATCEANPLLTFVDVWQPMLGVDRAPRKELLAADGLHLSEAGYRLWAELIRPHLEKE
jgi:lysophospholipase L1-like esterase